MSASSFTSFADSLPVRVLGKSADEFCTIQRLYNHTAERHAKCMEVITSNPLAAKPDVEYSFGKVHFEVFFNCIFLYVNDELTANVQETEILLLKSAPQDLILDSIDAMLHELSYGRPAVGYMPRERVAEGFQKLWNRMNDYGAVKEFDPSWANGTGYFLVTKIPGEREFDSFAFTDDKGRKGIVMWDFRTQSRVVMFQRYSDTGLVAYNHSFGCAKGVSGSGAVHTTPYMLVLLEQYYKETMYMASK